jgi:hypothetical protein
LKKANNWLYLGNNNHFLKLDEQVASEEFQTIVKVEKEEDDDSMQSKQRRKTCKLLKGVTLKWVSLTI